MTITRSMAYAEADPLTIASILDDTDYLINLMLYGEEEPGEFDAALKDLGKKFPEFARLSEEFSMVPVS